MPGLIARSSTNRSEERTSELQSRRDLVCRLLLEQQNLLSMVVSVTGSEVGLPPLFSSFFQRPLRPTLFPYTTLFRSILKISPKQAGRLMEEMPCVRGGARVRRVARPDFDAWIERKKLDE